jgi:hypothetical protein
MTNLTTQLKTSDVRERNIFILLQVSNKLQRIQSLKVELAYYENRYKCTITNYTDEYHFNP